MTDNKKKVGIWIRVSTEDQAKGDSPEHHEARAKMYAEVKDWEVVEVYHLEGVSGKSVMEQPETVRMLHDIKIGKISGLIFSKLARLARNTKELLDFSEIFRNCNADLISLHESIDTSSPAGRLFYTLIAAMAQWEREEISERVAATVPIRAKLGKSTGGAAPFGYRWNKQTLELDPKEAPVRKLMYELYAKHKRKKTVARLLNEQGHRTRGGKPFAHSSIDRLLKDPIAKGLRRMNYTKSLGKDKQWVLKDEKDWIFMPAPAIVSEELWDECDRIFKEQYKPRNYATKKVVNLFAGYAICHCGGKMYVPSNHPKYTCVKCRNKIGRDDLEEIFQEQLKDFLLSEEKIANYLSQTVDQIKDKEKLVLKLETEAEQLKKKLTSMLELVSEGKIPKEDIEDLYTPKRKQYSQILEQIPILKEDIINLKIQYSSSDKLLASAEDLYHKWPSLSFDEKRTVVETILNHVKIAEDNITFDLAYFPSSEFIANGSHTLRD